MATFTPALRHFVRVFLRIPPPPGCYYCHYVLFIGLFTRTPPRTPGVLPFLSAFVGSSARSAAPPLTHHRFDFSPTCLICSVYCCAAFTLLRICWLTVARPVNPAFPAVITHLIPHTFCILLHAVPLPAHFVWFVYCACVARGPYAPLLVALCCRVYLQHPPFRGICTLLIACAPLLPFCCWTRTTFQYPAATPPTLHDYVLIRLLPLVYCVIGLVVGCRYLLRAHAFHCLRSARALPPFRWPVVLLCRAILGRYTPRFTTIFVPCRTADAIQ